MRTKPKALYQTVQYQYMYCCTPNMYICGWMGESSLQSSLLQKSTELATKEAQVTSKQQCSTPGCVKP